MSTLVSKNTLSRMRFYSVKDESRRQGTAQFAQATERLLFALIATYLEDSPAGDSNLNVISFLEIERLHHCGGQSNGQAITPFRDLHGRSIARRSGGGARSQGR